MLRESRAQARVALPLLQAPRCCRPRGRLDIDAPVILCHSEEANNNQIKDSNSINISHSTSNTNSHDNSTPRRTHLLCADPVWRSHWRDPSSAPPLMGLGIAGAKVVDAATRLRSRKSSGGAAGSPPPWTTERVCGGSGHVHTRCNGARLPQPLWFNDEGP